MQSVVKSKAEAVVKKEEHEKHSQFFSVNIKTKMSLFEFKTAGLHVRARAVGPDQTVEGHVSKCDEHGQPTERLILYPEL